MSFQLFSDDLQDGGRLPLAHVANMMGHQGENISPHLSWSGAPEGTRSFAVTMYDPDAPTGSGWWHWCVANIPASTQSLPRGCGSGLAALPTGAVQTRVDAGVSAYTGAAPPPGPAHRYIFTLHALKVDVLPVDANTSGAMLGFMLHFNSLGKALLTVNYGG